MYLDDSQYFWNLSWTISKVIVVVCPEVCDTYNLDSELLHFSSDDKLMKK